MSLVENLSKDYGDFRIHIPRWEISDHGITALKGPSGAGKTSVFRLLIGLDSCPGLRWNFKGIDLAGLNPPERELGIVFQTLELFPHMSAEENILFAAKARGLSKTEAALRLKELASDLRMHDYLPRKAAVLSGGEAQRVALARAVIARPRFLFLDEPFSSLDPELRSEARQLVKRVIERLGLPTLLITHDQADLDDLAETVVTIQNGQLQANR